MTAKENNEIQAVHRLEFYFRGYHLWRFVAFAEAIALILIASAMLALILLWSPEDRFFAYGPDSQYFQIQPLDTPNKTEAQLRTWVITGVMECSTFGHHDYPMRLAQCREFFTEDGYEAYYKQLTNPSNQIWERIVINRQVMSAIPTNVPVIVNKTLLNDVVNWTFEIPVTLSFKKGDKTKTLKQLIQIVVSRVETTERLSGLGITQWRAKNV